MKQLGRWTSKHAEAIYGTKGGIPPEYFLGRSTISADSTKLYLFIDRGKGGEVVLRGLINDVKGAYVVGSGTKLSTRVIMKQSWNDFPGLLYVDIPDEAIDPEVTVIALLLDGPLRLGSGPQH